MKRNFTFDLIDPEEVHRLQECQTKKELGACLSSSLGRPLMDRLLAAHPEDKRAHLRQVFVDCCVLVCEKFLPVLDTVEKISVAVQVVFDTFVTSFREQLSSTQSLDLMCSTLNRHAAPDPPSRFMVFELNDIKVVSSAMVDHFFASYDQFYGLFTTVLVTNFRWGPANMGRFPKCLPLDYGKPVETPANLPVLKQLYFSQKADDELDDLEMEELLKGNGGDNLTMQKREAIIRRRMEEDRRRRIEKVTEAKLQAIREELGVQIDDLRKEFDLTEG